MLWVGLDLTEQPTSSEACDACAYTVQAFWSIFRCRLHATGVGTLAKAWKPQCLPLQSLMQSHAFVLAGLAKAPNPEQPCHVPISFSMEPGTKLGVSAESTTSVLQ